MRTCAGVELIRMARHLAYHPKRAFHIFGRFNDLSYVTMKPSQRMNRENARVALEKKLRSTTSPWDRLPILIELAREPESDPEYAYRCAQEALTIATSLNDRFWIARSMRAVGMELMKKAQYSEVLHYLKKASRIFGQLNDLTAKAQTDFSIAVTYVFMGKFNEAMALLTENLPIYEMMADRVWIVRAYRYFGYICKMVGDHSKGIEYYQQGLEIAVESNLEAELASLYQYMALSYQEIGDHKHHRDCLFKCLTICRKLDDKTGLATVTANIAIMYMERNLPSRAEQYIRHSGRLCRELGFTANEAFAWGLLADIHSQRGDFAKASRCFRKGLTLAVASEHKVFTGSLYDHFGVACLNAGKPERGLRYLKEGLRILSEVGYAHIHYEVHEHLSAAYEALNDTAKALEHHKEYIRIKEEYINTQKVLEAGQADMQAQFRKLTERLKKERSITTSLKKIIEKKEAELVSLTLRLVQEENRKNDIGNGMTSLKKSPDRKPSDNWDIFAQQFHKVHHGFYADLVRRYPELTLAEVKVCSLIRIGLSSKEMASLLGISKRTVDTHRTRVHKKIGLPSGTSLSAFIVRM